MRTCLENCRAGDQIYWKCNPGGRPIEDAIFVVRDPMDTGVVITTAANDGRVVEFYQRDLIANKSGYVISKIVKKSNALLPN